MTGEVSNANAGDPAANTSNKANGDAKKPELPAANTSASSATEPELSNAEKKKRKQAEKAAKRAQGREAPPPAEATTANGPKAPSRRPSASARPGQGDSSKTQTQAKGGAGQQQSPITQPASHTRSGSTSTSAQPQQIPLRQRTSQAQTTAPKLQSKQVAFFSHLYGEKPKRVSLEGTAKDVHPAIMALGLQISNYTICGSQARTVAMLLAFKSVIQSYITPHGHSFPHHLPNHGLSPHISHLRSHRTLCVAQSNAIRWLKIEIAKVDPSASERTARADVCNAIDTFIRERFTIADQIIADATVEHIRDGDVIVTFAKSAVVMKALLAAKENGKNFSVVVVDSRPRFEGRNMAITLSSAGVKVRYAMTSSVSQAMRGATKCILGAHGIMGDGRLHSRIGTSLVAMQAKQYAVPVLVCAESVKFSDKVTLDSTGNNEIAPEDELVDSVHGGAGILKDWRSKDNLYMLNLLYDTTPVEYLDMIITELGSLPPSSAPVVQRISAAA